MAQTLQDLALVSLRGGQNDTTPPHLLPDDQCVQATNVEFFLSAIGERRLGTVSFDSSPFVGSQSIVHLKTWFPKNNPQVPYMWAVGATPGAASVIAYWQSDTTTPTWSNAVTPADALPTVAPYIYQIASQALGNTFGSLLFWAYKSAVDRLHVWDQTNGTVLRRTGLAQPATAPTAANEGGGAFPAIKRYYRIRFDRQGGAGSTVTVRSEPSLSVAFTPSGGGAGVTITRPALLGEGETHWEIEASLDNATFYSIYQSIAAATTTFNDTYDPTVGGYAAAAGAFLSEAIGAYLLQPSAKFLAVDGDRILLGSHVTDTTRQSSVWWTPTQADPGVGNSERLPIVTTGGLPITNNLVLDNYEGGGLTGISNAINGVWYAFKWGRIYQLTRTGDVVTAYAATTLSNSRGAMPGSIFSGVDENGSPCIYFLDPMMGPSRIGVQGLQVLTGLRTTWARVNLTATADSSGQHAVRTCGIYYPAKQQAIWWVPVDGSNVPNLRLTLQVSEIQATNNWGGAARGWSTATGLMSNAYCVTTYPEQVVLNGLPTWSERPFIGLPGPNLIQRCDVGSTDNGVPYVATITTRPYLINGLLNRWGVMDAGFLATAITGSQVVVRLIRDFGLENSVPITVSLSPTANESEVIAILDNMAMSGARSIQFQFSDQ
jgi:hypothetical protein